MIESVPIACTLDGADQVARAAEFRALMSRARRATRGGDGVCVWFALAERDVVDDLTRREKECCAFFSFAISIGDEELQLEVRAPADAQPMIDTLFALVAH